MRDRLRSRVIVTGLLWLALLAAGLVATTTSGHGPQLRVVCSSIEDLCQEWGRDFTRSTGIPTAVVRLSSGQALARIERGDGGFDVWHGGPAQLYELAAARQLLQPSAPAEAASIPAADRSASGLWYGTYVGVLGFCSNRAALERLGMSAPHRWSDLLDPRLHGRISLPDPQSSGTGYTMLWAQAERLGGTQPALDFFGALNPNVLQYTVSGTAPAGIAGRGEAAVAVTFTQHCAKAHDQGLPQLEISYPDDATAEEVGGVAVLARTPRADAARRYVDYALSRRAQELGAGTASRQLPTRPDADADPRLFAPASTRLLSNNPAAAAARRDELVAAFNARIRT